MQSSAMEMGRTHCQRIATTTTTMKYIKSQHTHTHTHMMKLRNKHERIRLREVRRKNKFHCNQKLSRCNSSFVYYYCMVCCSGSCCRYCSFYVCVCVCVHISLIRSLLPILISVFLCVCTPPMDPWSLPTTTTTTITHIFIPSQLFRLALTATFRRTHTQQYGCVACIHSHSNAHK